MKRNIAIQVASATVAMAMLFGQGAALASTGSQSASLRGAAYLKTKIHDDGGFGVTDSTVTETCQAIIAIRSAGAKLPKTAAGKTAIGYLVSNVSDLTDTDPTAVVNNAGKIAQLVMALEYAGENPKTFGDTNWLAVLEKGREKATGWYGTSEIVHCWVMLALESAGQRIDPATVGWLTQNQEDNGGFALDKKNSLGADTNTTALAIQALIGAGEKPTSTAVKKALDFLKTQQNKDGGFPFVTPSTYGTDSDGNSTAWVIQALLAAGQDIESHTWVKTNVTPMGFLMSLQNADGAVAYQRTVTDDNLSTTCAAVPALAVATFPYHQPPAPKKVSGIDSSARALYIGFGVAALLAIILIGLYFGFMRKKA